eukprot:1854682-Rhodomonas_salina.1
MGLNIRYGVCGTGMGRTILTWGVVLLELLVDSWPDLVPVDEVPPTLRDLRQMPGTERGYGAMRGTRTRAAISSSTEM